jgi:STE24 endopeptidase
MFSGELYAKTVSYQVDKWWFGLVKGVWDMCEGVALMAFGGLPLLWQAAGRVLQAVNTATSYPATNEIWHTITFVLLLTLLNTATSLPWSLYSTFVIEQKHGFNKQTPGLFLKDIVLQVRCIAAL